MRSSFAIALGIALLSSQVCFAQDPQKRGDWVIHRGLGMLAADKQDYDTAVREFSRSIELSKDRESKDLYISRADAFVGLGRYEEAISDYLRAVRLSQRNAGEIMGPEYRSRTRTHDLAPIYDKLAAAYAALAAKSRELK